MKSKYHEREIITLTARQSLSRLELHKFLKSRGFRSEDDFFFLDRSDIPTPWQSISVMSVDVFNKGAAVYDTEEDLSETTGEWDELKVKYLLASLPQHFIEKCASECQSLAGRFNLQIKYADCIIDSEQLQKSLQQIADGLGTNFDEPGSEILGLLIAMEYEN